MKHAPRKQTAPCGQLTTFDEICCSKHKRDAQFQREKKSFNKWFRMVYPDRFMGSFGNLADSITEQEEHVLLAAAHGWVMCMMTLETLSGVVPDDKGDALWELLFQHHRSMVRSMRRRQREARRLKSRDSKTRYRA